VLWPFALNTHSGYLSVSETLRMAGRNCGLAPLQYVARVLMPAALPSIIAGLKIAWAFGWRTLIAAELVFGASSAGGGVGWVAHGAAASPSVFQVLTLDALVAHRLYVVEVRHPVEVPGSERTHLQQWLTKRCGWDVRAPELDATGLKLVGGRLLPGPTGPASFLMYESASGERFTLYTSKAKIGTAQMRYTAAENSGAMYWSEDGVGYVLSGPIDKDRLNQVARQVYDQTEKTRS